MTTYINRAGVLFDAATRAAVGLCNTDGIEAIGFSAPTVQAATSRALTADDNGKTIECTSTITLTLPVGLKNFRCVVIPQGTTSIASDGASLVNGSNTTATRAATTNPLFHIAQRASAAGSFVISGA